MICSAVRVERNTRVAHTRATCASLCLVRLLESMQILYIQVLLVPVGIAAVLTVECTRTVSTVFYPIDICMILGESSSAHWWTAI